MAQNDKAQTNALRATCHTEQSEVSTNSKCKFTPLRRGFFTLNLKCVLNSVDISLSLNMTIWIFRFLAKAQNDNSGVDFSLVSLAQNDSSVDFLLRLRLVSRLVAFYKRLKMTMPCRLCKSCICLVMKGKYTNYENLFLR